MAISIPKGLAELFAQWGRFFSIALEPITTLFTAALIGLYVYSSSESGAQAPILIYVLITITSAILGGRITKKWVEINEGNVVAARGKSAVRSLQLQLRSIATLEDTIRRHRRNEDEIEQHPQVVKRNYEEAVRTCQLLQEQTVSAIENWTDIVPEADIKSQIGIISELKLDIEKKEGDLGELKSMLAQAKGRSDDEKAKLKDQITKKEKQIAQLQREALGAKLNITGLSGMPLERLGYPFEPVVFPNGLLSLGAAITDVSPDLDVSDIKIVDDTVEEK